jgi:hypothetical protein
MFVEDRGNFIQVKGRINTLFFFKSNQRQKKRETNVYYQIIHQYMHEK